MDIPFFRWLCMIQSQGYGRFNSPSYAAVQNVLSSKQLHFRIQHFVSLVNHNSAVLGKAKLTFDLRERGADSGSDELMAFFIRMNAIHTQKLAEVPALEKG